jgi:hypothetical protein
MKRVIEFGVAGTEVDRRHGDTNAGLVKRLTELGFCVKLKPVAATA